MTKLFKLSDFLEDHEINYALNLKTKQKIKERIIVPNLDRINKALGQENDADYLAYAVEYAVVQVNQGINRKNNL